MIFSHFTIYFNYTVYAYFLFLRFMQDLEDMLGFRPYAFYYYMWRYVSPAVLIVLITATVIEMAVSPAGYNAWVESEVSAQLVCSVLLCIISSSPLVLIFVFFSILFPSQGLRALPKLSSLGIGHGLRPHHRGDAAFTYCLHCPSV